METGSVCLMHCLNITPLPISVRSQESWWKQKHRVGSITDVMSDVCFQLQIQTHVLLGIRGTQAKDATKLPDNRTPLLEFLSQSGHFLARATRRTLFFITHQSGWFRAVQLLTRRPHSCDFPASKASRLAHTIAKLPGGHTHLPARRGKGRRGHAVL